MKVLFWYCKEFKIRNIILSKRIKEIKQDKFIIKNISEENVIVPWITIENLLKIKMM